jgi:hypothetical protein
MAKLGQLGCSGTEARARLARLLDMGLADMAVEQSSPLTVREASFIRDMHEAIENNPNFEPSYGQVTWMEDLKEKYL